MEVKVQTLKKRISWGDEKSPETTKLREMFVRFRFRIYLQKLKKMPLSEDQNKIRSISAAIAELSDRRDC